MTNRLHLHMAHMVASETSIGTILERVHIAIDSAIVGYSILQLLALRHRDNYLAVALVSVARPRARVE